MEDKQVPMAERPEIQPGVAAARLTMDTTVLLQRALESRPDISIADIAEKAGVSEERVRWVFNLNDLDDLPAGTSEYEYNSNGNIHTSMVARYLRILGYRVKMEVEAVDDKSDATVVNPKPRKARRRNRD